MRGKKFREKMIDRIISLSKYGIIWAGFNFIGLFIISLIIQMRLNIFVWGTMTNILAGLLKYYITAWWKVYK